MALIPPEATQLPNDIGQQLDQFPKQAYPTLLNLQVRTACPHRWGLEASGKNSPPDLLRRLDPQTHSQFHTEALIALAIHSQGQEEYQARSLRAIRSRPRHLQASLLQQLIPSLQSNQRSEAANIIRELDNPDKTRTFVALACAHVGFRDEAQTLIKQLLDNDSSEPSSLLALEQFSVLAVEIPELLPELVEQAEKIQPPSDRLQTLIALSPHFPIRVNNEVARHRALSHTITEDFWQRALFILKRSYRDALKDGSLRNESAQADDLLNLKDEVNALADLLLMRDLAPPMAVGILGGWGGGKSYIMHLMQQHMADVRSRPVNITDETKNEAWNADPNNEHLSPYVGHIYQIKFDAWTFAKSNLWASLMQTIFFELNRQISLEQRLQKCFAEQNIDPYAPNSPYNDIWQVLYQASDIDREHFLQQVFKDDTLSDLSTEQQDRIDKLLWDKRDTLKQAAIEQQNDIEAELTAVRDSLAEQEAKLQAAQQSLENLQDPDKQDLVNHINQVLVVSGALLKNRLGEDTFKQIQQGIESQLPSDLTPQSFRKFQMDVRQLMTNLLEGQDADGQPFNFSGKVLQQWAQRNLSFIVIFGLFALSTLISPWLVAWKLPDAIVPQIVAFVTPLLPAIGMAQKLWRAGQQWHDQTKQALLDCEAEIQGSQAIIQRETRRLQIHQEHRIQAIKDQIEQLQQQAQMLDQQKQAVQAEIPANVYASLGEFIAQRIQAGEYDRHLGLMHFVKEDLAKLSDRLLPPKLGSEEFVHKLEDLKQVFPRGPARVVVYIDDLDRCPPGRVVEVLEAVQLLVKTPLFIAVLAVDERYITRALEHHYQGVLHRKGSPSGTDYLEKIIQLPYRVRPITANALESYLRAQVVIQDNASGASKFSEFTRQEFDMLKECCRQTGLSPRTLKRLTNVYKLFKVVCRTRGTKPSLPMQQAILALLALSGRYPNLMRGIFDSIESCYEEERTRLEVEQLAPKKTEAARKRGRLIHLDSLLREVFEQYELPADDQYLQREFDKLIHDALETTMLPPTLTLAGLSHEIFNLIRSFSFVGEIGEDPEDYRDFASGSGEHNGQEDLKLRKGRRTLQQRKRPIGELGSF